MKLVQKGFTLIELMIVVAIIAILAAIAIPAYQDYAIRAQVSEGFILAEGAKIAMAEYYSVNGNLPASGNDTFGLADPTQIKGRYVGQVDAGSQAGVIIVRFNGPDSNAAISTSGIGLQAVVDPNGGPLQWRCDNPTFTTVPNRYLPASCRIL
jgi:type IV pilus assembly protein PilA